MDGGGLFVSGRRAVLEAENGRKVGPGTGGTDDFGGQQTLDAAWRREIIGD